MFDWIKSMGVDDFKEESTLFIYNERRFVLFKKKENYYALEDNCSHDTASLSEGTLCDFAILCPRHGAKFDIRSGKNLSFPAVTPVKSYEVKVEDGFIWIKIDD